MMMMVWDQLCAQGSMPRWSQSILRGTVTIILRIIANPHFKEVPEDIQRLGMNGAGLQEMQERPGYVRALLFKVQIGDQ